MTNGRPTEPTPPARTQDEEPLKVPGRRKAVTAGAIGLALEHYDFAIYGFLTPIIATLFFPQADPTTALLAAWIGFSAGVVARPLGAAFFGHLGDKAGRRTVLVAMTLIIAVCTVGIGLLPTYAQIGAFAAVLLFFLRVIQGFGFAAEAPTAFTFMTEYAPSGRRGFYASFAQVGTIGGVVLAAGVGALTTGVLSEEAMQAWGWRVPFLAGVVPALVALYLRLRVADTPTFQRLKETRHVERAPLLKALRRNPKAIAIVFVIYVYWLVLAQMKQGYGPSYTATYTDLQLSGLLLIQTITLGAMMAIVPFFGIISDRIGRRPMIAGSCLATAVLSYPLFWLMLQGSLWAFALAQVVFLVLYGLMAGAVPAAFAEIFPPSVRVAALSIGLVAAAITLGANTGVIATGLIALTGVTIAPAFFLIAVALVGLAVSVFALKETKSYEWDSG